MPYRQSRRPAWAGPGQLGLLGEDELREATHRQTSFVIADDPESSMPPEQCYKAALAVLTDLFRAERPSSNPAIEHAATLIYHHAHSDHGEIALALAWIAATYLGFIEGLKPGLGEEMLAKLGSLIAGMAE